ncbi:MAG: hypothetical protein JXR78_15220, partial [Victivallales bacterium]|nr:hypothetical protein [Victivallales bacterium]
MRKNRFLTLFKFAPDDGSGGGLFSAADLGGDSSPTQTQTEPAAAQPPQQSTAQPEQTQAQTERLTPEKSPQSSDWKSSLPEELRDNPSLSKFKDVNSLAQSYVSTKALVGQNTVKLPSETSSPEDWNKFYTTLGRPDSPEGYEIKRNEQIPEEYRNSPDVEAFKKTFHELGLSAKQVNGIMSKYDEQLVASMANIDKQRAESVKQTVQKLRNDWGNDFENNIALADMAFNQLDTDGELETSGV